MQITRKFFRTHKLLISESKSKVMSYNATSGKTTFEGFNIDPLILEEVLFFKYLGIKINCTPHNLFKSFNDDVKRKAQSYLSSVFSLTRAGPNRSALAHSLWTLCAIPAICYGAEIIPLTKDTIRELEKCNTMVGKFILQIPRSSADVSCYIDAGIRPISSIIAEKVLLYAHSTMTKPTGYWSKLAMTEHLLLGPLSSYTRYLQKWKTDTNCLHFTPKHIKIAVKSNSITNILDQQRTTSTTTFAMLDAGPTCSKHPWFKPKAWVSDSGFSRIISSFRVCNTGIGNRGPAKNGRFYKLCPLCSSAGTVALNNEVKIDITLSFTNHIHFQVHLLIECAQMKNYRESCGLGPFISAHRLAKPGISSIKLFALFLSDRDPALLQKRALDLYTMKLGWHNLMDIDI